MINKIIIIKRFNFTVYKNYEITNHFKIWYNCSYNLYKYKKNKPKLEQIWYPSYCFLVAKTTL